MGYQRRVHGDRRKWIIFVCCIICALSIVLWIWICIALLIYFDFGAINDASLLDMYPSVLKGDDFTESTLSACLLTLSLYVAVVIVPKLVSFLCYFVLFGVHAVESWRIAVLFMVNEVSG